MHKISVCVPTYNRPETLEQLINSFVKQDYKNKELIISDDTPDESIKKVVEKFKNPSIKYFHNKKSLRFARNLYTSIKRATGDYIIILGDDDIFLNIHVLSKYVDCFRENSSVHFVYSSQVQFSDQLEIEYIINFSEKNKKYRKGSDAMKNIWMRSLFIGGMGMRNTKNLLRFFPDEKILYPQVEFIGNIVNNYDAYLLRDNNIGFRSHDDQIIFRALKDRVLQQQGEHTTVEFFQIFQKLKKTYNLNLSSNFLERQLIDLQFILMFKEKSNLGSNGMKMIYEKFLVLSPLARKSIKLKIGFFLAMIIPSEMIILIRSMIFKIFRLVKKNDFQEYKKNLLFMISK